MEELSLEGMLGPTLRQRLLVRAQVGAKRGKLTLLEALRGTKMELKGALEAPREAKSSPKIRTTLCNKRTTEWARASGRGRA